MAGNVARDLASLAVNDESGRPVTLGSLWADRPAVLVFVRQFGWLACRQQVAGLAPRVAEVERRGARVVVVGNGARDAMESFRRTTAYGGPLFTDPSLAAYRAAGLASGIATILNPRAIAKNVAAMLRGTRPGRPSGNALQQGGTFVLGPGDVERFAWRDRFSGDVAPFDRVLAALPA